MIRRDVVGEDKGVEVGKLEQRYQNAGKVGEDTHDGDVVMGDWC